MRTAGGWEEGKLDRELRAGVWAAPHTTQGPAVQAGTHRAGLGRAGLSRAGGSRRARLATSGPRGPVPPSEGGGGPCCPLGHPEASPLPARRPGGSSTATSKCLPADLARGRAVRPMPAAWLSRQLPQRTRSELTLTHSHTRARVHAPQLAQGCEAAASGRRRSWGWGCWGLGGGGLDPPGHPFPSAGRGAEGSARSPWCSCRRPEEARPGGHPSARRQAGAPRAPALCIYPECLWLLLHPAKGSLRTPPSATGGTGEVKQTRTSHSLPPTLPPAT